MKKFVFFTSILFAGNVLAAAGESTVSLGYIQTKSDGVKKQFNGAEDLMRELGRQASAAYGTSASIHSDGYEDPKGFFARYRYEITDELGVIGSLAYATQDGSVKGNAANQTDAASAKFDIESKYFSALVGPAFRLNEYASLYGMIGFAHKKVDERAHATERAGSITTTLFNEHYNDSKTSLAYSIGAQFNVYEGVTLDAAYEGSAGGGDWKTNGFTVGLGYKF
ncbi:Ail/Lom family outer membrane beta-barrel protein [Salmonella enterica]